VCDKASSTDRWPRRFGPRPAWHQAIVDIDGESLKGR
jgi:hypothetical protein